MRNHSAWVVLGACLLSAAAAAQVRAPSSSLLPSGGGASPAPVPSPEPEAGLLGDVAIGERLSLPQDPVDYSLRGLFRGAYGDFMDRRERFDPNVELRVRALPNARVNRETGSFDMLGYDLDAEIPAYITPDAYFLLGTYYYGRRYVTSGNFGINRNPEALGDETIIATGLRLGFAWFLDKDILFEIETNPGVYSDMEKTLTRKDYDFPSSALLTFRVRDEFFLKVGGRYNQIFEDAPWLPYLGFSWQVNESFRIDVLAPEKLEFSWWPSAGTAFLLGGQITGAEYSVSTRTPAGRQRADLQVQEVYTYLGLLHRFDEHTSFEARVGLVVAGDYNLTSGAANFNRIEGMLDPTFYAEFSFGVHW